MLPGTDSSPFPLETNLSLSAGDTSLSSDGTLSRRWPLSDSLAVTVHGNRRLPGGITVPDSACITLGRDRDDSLVLCGGMADWAAGDLTPTVSATSSQCQSVRPEPGPAESVLELSQTTRGPKFNKAFGLLECENVRGGFCSLNTGLP